MGLYSTGLGQDYRLEFRRRAQALFKSYKSNRKFSLRNRAHCPFCLYAGLQLKDKGKVLVARLRDLQTWADGHTEGKIQDSGRNRREASAPRRFATSLENGRLRGAGFFFPQSRPSQKKRKGAEADAPYGRGIPGPTCGSGKKVPRAFARIAWRFTTAQK